MKNILYFVLCFIVIAINSVAIFAEQQVFCIDEELEYDVTFFSVSLGKIKILTFENDQYKGQKTAHTKVYIESNKNIPFASMKAVFNSFMDTSLTYGRYFESTVNDGNNNYEQKIIFEYPEKQSLKIKKIENGKSTNDTTIKANGKVLDGATLFFFARKFVDNKKKLKIPTIMDMSVVNTFLNFTGKTEKVKIDAVNYPIKTYHFTGKADWEALYGLGGDFEGWFSCDEARVPIKAKMNVYVGSVVLELKKWKRKNWSPPKYN